MSEPVSRRVVAQRGLVLGGAFATAAALAPLLPVRAALAASSGDQAVLEAALRLEQSAVVAYDAAAQSGVLDRQADSLADVFREQEQAHADALQTALVALGARAPAPPKAGEIAGLSRVRTQAGFVRFLIALELRAVAAYYDAQHKLADPELLSLAARIMANEGQHLALLRPLAGVTAVPHAFERGVA